MKQFLQAGHLPTLAASLLHFDTSFMLWVLMGALGVLVAADLGLSPSEKGLLVGVPLLGGALWRVPVGLLSDRAGAKRVGVVTILITLVPLGLAWLVAKDLPSLLAVGLLLGVAGSSFAVALPLASRSYPLRYQGTAMGIAATGNSGAVVANLLAPRLGETAGWHQVFGLALIPACIVTVLFVAMARDDAPRKPAESARFASPSGRGRLASGETGEGGAQPENGPGLAAMLREADLWWFCLLYSMTFGGYAGLSSFLGIYFHDQYSIDAVAAGGLVALCALAGSLVRPLGGALADRFGGVSVLSGVFLLLPLVLVAPAAGAPMSATLPALVTAMACLGMGNGAVFQLVPHRFGDRVGLATGVTGAAGGIGGFVLPVLLGVQRELTGSYAPGFTIYALSLAYMFLCVKALAGGWRFTWLSRPQTSLQEADRT